MCFIRISFKFNRSGLEEQAWRVVSDIWLVKEKEEKEGW